MVPTYLKKAKKITVERQVDLKDFNKPVHFLQDNVRSKRMKSSNTFFLMFCLFTNFAKRPG